MPNWIIGFGTALTLVFIGWFLSWLQRKMKEKDEKREAVAALRFELESNLKWTEDILESHNYLRSDAWSIMKDKGYISYLRKPIPLEVIRVYDQMHRMNRFIKLLRENSKKVDTPINKNDADNFRTQLKESIHNLIKLLDDEYPRIGKNFK